MRLRIAQLTAAIVALIAAILAPVAMAHTGHSHEDEDRIPGQPDFQRIGKVEVRFHPNKGEYTYKRPNEPPLWFHRDSAPEEFPMSPGGNLPLPEFEEGVTCADSGHRIKIMYSGPTSRATPSEEEVEAIRDFVRKMNWKVLSESERSSNNTRALSMRVDCNAMGEIKVWTFVSAFGTPSQVFGRAEDVYGYPTGADSVKNLIFYSGTDCNPPCESSTEGYGQQVDDSIKSSSDTANGSRARTTSAVVYRPMEGIRTLWGSWAHQATVHELFHTMGAVNTDAPYSTNGKHCTDGIDIMCYDDDSVPWWGPEWYSETRCPASSGFDKPVDVPLDCGYDSYFDALEESGEWLNTHWNTGGPENPFLVEKPTPQAPIVGTDRVSFPSSSTATLSGGIAPGGLPTLYYFEYGLTNKYGAKTPGGGSMISSNLYGVPHQVSRLITGLQPNTTYHYRLVASNAKGTSPTTIDKTFTTPAWNAQTLSNPSGSNANYLYDVNCEPSSTNLCMAAGKSTSSGVDSALIQQWNGTSWSLGSPAQKSGANTRLLGVDCPSATRCLAAGNYEAPGSGSATLAELWNENKWSIQSTPVPAGATSSELAAIGCNNTAECAAVGSAMVKGVETAIAAKWKSPTWTLQSVPIPAEATSSRLDGVDCQWSNYCVAVGHYTLSNGFTRSLTLFWNGSEWVLQKLSEPQNAVQSTLLDVSCSYPPNACMAVGGWKSLFAKQFTLAYRLSGSTWTLQSTANEIETDENVLQDVSCQSSTSCTAVGSWVASGGSGSDRTLAEDWDGSSWSLKSTPNLSGATFSAFFGTSCRVTTCLAVGWNTTSTGLKTSLAQIR